MERLPILTALHGIATPTASTILHYIYPDLFPIIDIRTVEVLNLSGLLLNSKRNDAAYPEYQAVILTLQKQYPHWNLRQIDRALFTYHKVGLGRSADCVV